MQWKIKNPHVDSTLLMIENESGDYIAMVPGNPVEQKQNAALIAAAPDLLSACYAAAVRLEGGTADERAFNESLARYVRAAIKKAENR